MREGQPSPMTLGPASDTVGNTCHSSEKDAAGDTLERLASRMLVECEEDLAQELFFCDHFVPEEHVLSGFIVKRFNVFHLGRQLSSGILQ